MLLAAILAQPECKFFNSLPTLHFSSKLFEGMACQAAQDSTLLRSQLCHAGSAPIAPVSRQSLLSFLPSRQASASQASHPTALSSQPAQPSTAQHVRAPDAPAQEALPSTSLHQPPGDGSGPEVDPTAHDTVQQGSMQPSLLGQPVQGLAALRRCAKKSLPAAEGLQAAHQFESQAGGAGEHGGGMWGGHGEDMQLDRAEGEASEPLEMDADMLQADVDGLDPGRIGLDEVMQTSLSIPHEQLDWRDETPAGKALDTRNKHFRHLESPLKHQFQASVCGI